MQRNECRRVGAYDEDAVSVETGVSFEGQRSRTQQSQAAETDINGIVKRFKVTGILPQGVRPPQYGDFTGVTDFRSAMDAIVAAERSFMSMSADVRKKFGNDPHEFVKFCSDPKNIDEMREMGLAVPAAPKPEPVEVRVMNQEPKPDPAPKA